MDQICLDPQDKLLPTPPPLGHTVNKTPSPHRTKKCLRPTHPTPEDNFWNSPKERKQQKQLDKGKKVCALQHISEVSDSDDECVF